MPITAVSITTTADPLSATTIDPQTVERLIGLVGEHNPRGGWDVLGTHYWYTDEALAVALREIAANDIGR
jgi:hypothetical protein